MLVMRDFELDTKGKFNLKRSTLMSEYPSIKNISMRGQADYIVLLKDLGFVAIEVKRTLNVANIQKAKDELDRTESFLSDTMLAVAPYSQVFPVVKLIIFEMDDLQNTIVPTSHVYHFFDCGGNSRVAFEIKWKYIKQELHAKSSTNSLTPIEFKRLARLLSGLWSLKSLNRRPYFDVDEASLHHLTKQVDCVNYAHLSSDAKKTMDPPVSNLVINKHGTVFIYMKFLYCI